MTDKDNLFGERLKSLRSMRGNKSQKEFAEELGIPQPTLSSYESGKIKPTIPIEEQRKRMLELMKAEWEALEKTDK